MPLAARLCTLPRWLSTTALTAALAFGVLPNVGAQAAGTAGDSLTTRSYASSTAEFANPDRGMYHYTETHLLTDGSGYTSLDATKLRTWRNQENITVVYRIFYLEKYKSVDTISATDLASVAADFTTARAAGVKLIVRFAYSSSSGADAPAARVIAQIRQLAPVLNAAADVIATLQAGFIGRWGEWYYSDNFTTNQTTPWALSDADWTARGSVLSALLDATDHQIPVQVRYPGIKQRLLPETDPRSSRVGIHDDCFLAGTDDYGTFAGTTDRAWLAAQTQKVAMGGESCTANAPRSLWPSASTDLAAYHWSFLNADFDSDVLGSWGVDVAEARRRLGYRLRLVQSAVPASTSAGALMAVQLTMANDGYAAPVSGRPVQLIMRSATTTFRLPLPVDVRSFQPGQTVVLPLQVPAPPTAGTYTLSLALPDAAPTLADQPAYSVQLANAGVWDALHGWNDLQQTVQVTTAAVPAPAPVSPVPPVSPTPTSAPVAVTALSDMTPTAVVNGWGPFEKDMSNGEVAAGDGRRLSLRGQQFLRGLGVHSPSSLTYPLGGAYSTFSATVGVDDETAGRGSVAFQVWVDGALRFTSPLLTGAAAAVPVTVAVAGAQSLRLVVTDGGDGTAYDHADWADPSLSPSTADVPTPVGPPPMAYPVPPVSPTPTSAPVAVTALSDMTPTAVVNGWGPFEKDMSNGEVAAGDGRRLSLRGQQFLRGLGVHSPSSLTYPLGGAYSTFSATVGVDDETAGRGSVAFQVWVDGALRFTSPLLTGAAAAVPVTVAVAGAQSLRLVVTDGGDGTAYDHADWADPSLSP